MKIAIHTVISTPTGIHRGWINALFIFIELKYPVLWLFQDAQPKAVAVCFTGHLRTLNRTWSSIATHFLPSVRDAGYKPSLIFITNPDVDKDRNDRANRMLVRGHHAKGVRGALMRPSESLVRRLARPVVDDADLVRWSLSFMTLSELSSHETQQR